MTNARPPSSPTLWLLLMATLVASPSVFARHRSAASRAIEAVTEKVEDSLVRAPVDGEACFSPDERCDMKLVRFVESAQSSIDVAIFDVNLDGLVHALLKAQARGVPVRFVVDLRQARSAHSAVPLLLRAGARLKIGRQAGIMHNKFIVLDGKRLELGSFNYTHGAAFKNNENQLYLGDAAIVARYRNRFEQIWRDGLSPDILHLDRKLGSSR